MNYEKHCLVIKQVKWLEHVARYNNCYGDHATEHAKLNPQNLKGLTFWLNSI